MQLLLIFAGSDRERQRLAQYLAAHRVDGVLLVSVHADDPLPDLLSQLEIPAVISGRRSAGETLPSVDSDNYGGGRAAVEHLIAQGRRTIVHLAGRLDVFGAQRRVDGYREGLREAGREPDDRLIVPGDFTEEGGRRAMAELLDRCPSSTRSSPAPTSWRPAPARSCARRAAVYPKTWPSSATTTPPSPATWTPRSPACVSRSS